MGARGPQPLPSAIKKARGTYRPDRAANEAPAIGRPRCPAWLSTDGKKEFRRVAKLLGDMSLAGAADENAITRYAATWVRWRQVVAALDTAGLSGSLQVYKDESGRVKTIQVGALATLVRGLGEELGRLEASLGMTPSARSRINVAVLPDVGELEF